MKKLLILFSSIIAMLSCAKKQHPAQSTNSDHPFAALSITSKNYYLASDPQQGHELDEGQIAFMDKCMKEGKSGCSITINNQQCWVSFYGNSQYK